MALVPVYRKDTGEQVYIPEHWIGHPTLGRPFRKTPPPEDPAGVSDLAAAGALGVDDAAEVAARALTQFNLVEPTLPTPKTKQAPATSGGDVNPKKEN